MLTLTFGGGDTWKNIFEDGRALFIQKYTYKLDFYYENFILSYKENLYKTA